MAAGTGSSPSHSHTIPPLCTLWGLNNNRYAYPCACGVAKRLEHWNNDAPPSLSPQHPSHGPSQGSSYIPWQGTQPPPVPPRNVRRDLCVLVWYMPMFVPLCALQIRVSFSCLLTCLHHIWICKCSSVYHANFSVLLLVHIEPFVPKINKQKQK